MRDLRRYHFAGIETTTRGSKVLGAAIVALGVAAFGAFASGNAPKPRPPLPAVSKEIATTPATSQSQLMPPPVAPTNEGHGKKDDKPKGAIAQEL